MSNRMNKFKIFIILSLSFLYSIAQESKSNKNFVKQRAVHSVTNDTMDVYSYIETMPEFPGGDKMLLKFFATNINYPQSAKMKGLQGNSLVQFIVDVNGNVCNAKILKGVPNCPQCDDEAIRVASILPKWQSGKTYDGKPANVYYVIPINFILTKGGCF
jgi:TonB family protein